MNRARGAPACGSEEAGRSRLQITVGICPSLPDPRTGRHAAEGASGPLPAAGTVVTDLRLRPPARRTPPRRRSSSRWRGPPPCPASRGSPPAGRSSRSQRLSAISRTSVARPGPSARTATMRPWTADSSRATHTKPPAAASGASASSPTRSTNVSGPNTAPGRCQSSQASGPLPARRGAQPHPVVSQRQHRLGGTGADRGRNDDIAASARSAEAGCGAAMPTNQPPRILRANGIDAPLAERGLDPSPHVVPTRPLPTPPTGCRGTSIRPWPKAARRMSEG